MSNHQTQKLTVGSVVPKCTSEESGMAKTWPLLGLFLERIQLVENQ